MYLYMYILSLQSIYASIHVLKAIIHGATLLHATCATSWLVVNFKQHIACNKIEYHTRCNMLHATMLHHIAQCMIAFMLCIRFTPIS